MTNPVFTKLKTGVRTISSNLIKKVVSLKATVLKIGKDFIVDCKKSLCIKAIDVILSLFLFKRTYSYLALTLIRSMTNSLGYFAYFDFDTFLLSFIAMYEWISINFKDKEIGNRTLDRLFLQLLNNGINGTSSEWKVSVLNIFRGKDKPKTGSWLLNLIRKLVNKFLASKVPAYSIWLNELVMNGLLTEIIFVVNLIIFNGDWNIVRFLLSIAYGIFKTTFIENRYKRLNEIGFSYCLINSLTILGCPYLSMNGHSYWSIALLILIISITSLTRKK